MSNQNNINMNPYKSMGRGRQGEDIVHDDYKHLVTQIARPGDDAIRTARLNAALDNRLANFRRLRRLKRMRKIRGLSARQLMERKISQRTTKELKPEPIATTNSIAESLNQGTVRDASF